MNFLKTLLGGTVAHVTVADLQARLKHKQKPVLVDVRHRSEFEAGHIAGSKHIELQVLRQKMSSLPQNRPLICICRSGARSSAAARHLASHGYEAYNLRGGILSWQRAGLPLKKGRN
ncbi:MAG: rhodanese-like domain-containing protein [Chloroflexi bacterium]|nr:rhodanese-like domain-containing protein [Chloroflexota bacterium]